MRNFWRQNKVDFFRWLGLFAGYFLTRLPNLGIIPIFTDEAIYLRWSQVMAYDASLRYLPLADGKQPLFMWATSVVMRLLPHLDPLLTSRLVSVGAGLAAIVGIYFASYQLFKNKTLSYLASIFYILVPFTFFYDRFGLADSLLAMFGIWSLGLGILLVKSGRLDVALILGMVLGFGRLTKTPMLFFVLFLPLYLLLRQKQSVVKLLALMALSGAISELFYSILRLFPLFNMIAEKNYEFTVPLGTLLRAPLAFAPGNLPVLLSWQVYYLTPLVAAASALGVIVGLKKHFWPTVVVFGSFLGVLGYLAFFNKVIYPRYLLTFTPHLLILAALAVSQLKKARLGIVLAALAIWPLYTNVLLVFNPVDAPLLQADRDQYLDGWPAGFGVKEVRSYLASHPGKAAIATEGTFGLMPYALELYQKDYPDLSIKPFWPLPDKPPAKFDYLLMYQSQKTPLGWNLVELLRFRQGKGSDYLRLYRVL